MNQRTLGYFYKAGIMCVYPIFAPIIIALVAAVLVAAFFFIPTLEVERNADGSLRLVY